VSAGADGRAVVCRPGLAPSGGSRRAAGPSPSVSPDGGRVAFIRGFDTWVVPLAGGPERLLARGVVDASWGGPLPGRPQLVPGSLRPRGRRATLRARCRAAAGCVAATWTLPGGGRAAARFAVPELGAGSAVRLRARLRRRNAVAIARSGPRGVRASLRGVASAPRLVRVRSAGRATPTRGRTATR
jgi:hypothetical protein